MKMIFTGTLTTAQLETMCLGEVDASTCTDDDVAVFDKSKGHDDGLALSAADGNKPSLESCINIYDFEAIASRIVPTQG